jgi:hypothetical protein
MTAVVLTLPVKTKRKEDTTAYYCLRCDGSRFQLCASGDIYCYGCGSLMRNLKVEKAID